MNRLWIVVLMAVVFFGVPHGARADGDSSEQQVESHSFLHKLVLYIPNRILDAFDMVRLRARVGPGVAVDARMTQPASVFAGSYYSVYVGLPGPRNRPMPKSPVGLAPAFKNRD